MRRRCAENQYSLMNRIMLGYRPIAPKPAAGAQVIPLHEADLKNGSRIKRKYVRARGRQRKIKDEAVRLLRSTIDDDTNTKKEVITTLQLLPENDRISNGKEQKEVAKYWNKIDGNTGGGGTGSLRPVMKTWIIVECVTETLISTDSGVVGLGLLSDRERINSLEMDTCPGFVSDGTNNVVWVNQAYRKMGGEDSGLMVWLVVKQKIKLACSVGGWFACRVRMIEETRHGHKLNRLVTCDVWRMDFCGFAWKLDLNTMLSL